MILGFASSYSVIVKAFVGGPNALRLLVVATGVPGREWEPYRREFF